VSYVEGATVERSVAHDNATGDAVGICASYATNVAIQSNESYRNGHGFSLDSGTMGSSLQYNYSHDNRGAGLRVAGVVGPPLHNDAVRYNVSENDAATGLYGIYVSDPMDSVDVHNNVVFAGPRHGPAISVVNSFSPRPAHVHNNVFVTAPGVQVVAAAEGTF